MKHALQISLRGRLGNQLFIYAFARSLALEMGLRPILVTSKAENRLDCFYLSPFVSFLPTIDYTIKQRIGDFIYRLLIRGGKSITQITAIERRWQRLFEAFDLFYSQEDCLKPQKRFTNMLALGFFQSEKCFGEHREQILRDLVFREEIIERCSEIIREMRSRETCCIHIRMGDYLNSDIFGVCTFDYYQRAINEMCRTKPHMRFFVFSDNIADVRTAYGDLLCNAYYVPEHFSDQESLYIASQCDNFIISNSTYSWWMQYLSKNVKKKVIAPSRWFNDHRPCHIYQSNWILIDP